VSAWDDLVSVALVGTERKPVPDGVAAGVAVALGADLPIGAPELTVLRAAGVLAAHRRAGFTVAHGGAAPEPAPPDARPLASTTAVQLLELLLGGQVSVPGGTGFLVAEWLERAGATGRRPPERLLPPLLAMATSSTDRSLRAAVVAAGGPRLRWLAARNEPWGWAAGVGAGAADAGSPVDAEAVWTTGDRQDRLAVLASLRATDPDEARRLVALTWSGEDAKDRAAIVELLAVGLGPADEPFLEAALDDRSKVVRPAAAELLHRLPGSALAARMAARVAPLVTVGGRLRKKLEVALPDDLDAAARRDGVVDAGAPPGLGPKAWWLLQIVAATPLDRWEHQLDLEPAAIARLAAEHREVGLGLALAAARQRDARWASALVAHVPDRGLLPVLPPAEVSHALGRILAAEKDLGVATALALVPGPWSAATSAVALDRLRAATSTGPLQQATPTLADRLHPGAAAAIERWVADLKDADQARSHVRALAHALSIRQTIVQELP
jgi:hypothetical protein